MQHCLGRYLADGRLTSGTSGAMLQAAHNSWAHDAVERAHQGTDTATRPARALSMAACLLELALSGRSGGI